MSCVRFVNVEGQECRVRVENCAQVFFAEKGLGHDIVVIVGKISSSHYLGDGESLQGCASIELVRLS